MSRFYHQNRSRSVSDRRIEAILYYMESRGLTRQDLEPAIGSRARVAEILNRKRPLTLEMIRRLHQQLGIPAQTLIQSYVLISA
jgi:HTH-type transcriptional regulator / antitoxin HigA